jgi:hypothetical protein
MTSMFWISTALRGCVGTSATTMPFRKRGRTPRKMHLLFVHAPGLHCSTGRIAPGVDVKAERGYCIW